MHTHLSDFPSEHQLPIFPLDLVLFPGGIVPLHIFEERYQMMIELCLEHQSLFGVVLIKDGEEAGEPAEPHHVGTAVEIIEVNQLEGGRLNVVTAGQYRFEILDIQQRLPYQVGRVRMPVVPDVAECNSFEPTGEEARELYQDYEALLCHLFLDWEPPEGIPHDSRDLAFQIGRRLHISLSEKQLLLETLPVDQLLTREAAVLKRENQKLRLQIAARNN